MTRIGGEWQNWARSARIRPQRIERPRTPEAVQRAVVAAAERGMEIKAVGASHSFSGIAAAPGVLLDTDDLAGLVSVDEARGRVTVLAGTRLHQMPRLLAPSGLAMPNLGDIDRQSVAGAVSTGTHGTGLGFGGLSSQVVGVTVVTADGAMLRVDEDHSPELLPAFALGLGALGVLVEVTLQCVPAFVLHAVERHEPVSDVQATMLDRVAGADHFEFYWFPHTDVAHTKTNTRLAESAARRPLSRVRKWLDERLVSTALYSVTCAVGTAVPALVPAFGGIAARITGRREYSDASPAVFTQTRDVRFTESEYAVPLEALPEAFAELRALIDRRRWQLSFPVEVRAAQADDRWLSTASGRDSGYIAVHRYWREDPTEYFTAVGEVMRAHGGRPHWGKMHDLDAGALRDAYPRFDDFLALRDRIDPDRRFRNRYLDRVLGA